jgi:hypothetical protein
VLVPEPDGSTWEPDQFFIANLMAPFTKPHVLWQGKNHQLKISHWIAKLGEHENLPEPDGSTWEPDQFFIANLMAPFTKPHVPMARKEPPIKDKPLDYQIGRA